MQLDKPGDGCLGKRKEDQTTEIEREIDTAIKHVTWLRRNIVTQKQLTGSRRVWFKVENKKGGIATFCFHRNGFIDLPALAFV
ncbi:hypothetical protein LRP50_12915 [Enterovibrio sp. ZSDZ42]|uniref:Uncharacterized protein n=1 Tax=Enterovibrio gelatinilyticus TaxID=2899819 RepID=A0ABT5R2Q1_9GAMM|nr:hypothetical protein [Enterovibrio sp. ZSDZ42]MDD1794036.1 hypothetical protein [Enterovibrio sp. ZSDZ42]